MSRLLLPAGMIAVLLSAVTIAAQVREVPQQIPPAPPAPLPPGAKAISPDRDVPAARRTAGDKNAPADKQAQRRRSRNRVYLGVFTVPVEDMSKRTLKKLKLPSSDGVLVVEVMPDSPADEAGLRHGDVITHVNGKLVEDEEELSKDLHQIGAGKPVKLDILRDGKKQQITAELEEGPAGEFSAPSGSDDEVEELMGMCHQNVQRIERLELKIFRLEKRLAEMERNHSVKKPQ